MCAQLGGLAIGATWRGLACAGAQCRPGFRAVAARMVRGLVPPSDFSAQRMGQALDAAVAVQRACVGAGAMPDVREYAETWSGGLLCVEGAVVSSVMTALARSGARDDLPRWTEERPELYLPCCEFLMRLGWVEPLTRQWTGAGRVAARCAEQYFHGAGYLPLLWHLPQVLAGDAETRAALAADRHVWRSIDIAASTQVFAALCQEPVLRLLGPIFDGPPDTWPEAVVDTGCGEGSLLAFVHTQCVRPAQRGQAGRPVVLVGIEPSAEARQVCARTLAELGASYHVLPGDISDPEGIADSLCALGIEPGRVLHVSKSVFHNRRLALSCAPAGTVPRTRNVFAWHGGEVADAALVEEDAVRVLRAWKEVLGRHGMLVIEAHTVEPTAIPAHDLRLLAAINEVTHGFSEQYLVEAAVWRTLLREAGLCPLDECALGAQAWGAPIMTLGRYGA